MTFSRDSVVPEQNVLGKQGSLLGWPFGRGPLSARSGWKIEAEGLCQTRWKNTLGTIRYGKLSGEGIFPREWGYSHSMVLGGFELISYTTLLIPLTSLVIRVEILSSTP